MVCQNFSTEIGKAIAIAPKGKVIRKLLEGSVSPVVLMHTLQHTSKESLIVIESRHRLSFDMNE